MKNYQTSGMLAIEIAGSSRNPYLPFSLAFLKRTGTKGVVTLFFCILLLLQVLDVKANNDASAGNFTENIVLKHLETIGDEMIFQVQVDNPEGEKVILTVKDEKRYVLFNQSYGQKKIAVNISAFKDEADRLFFIIKKGNGKPQTFDVNITYPVKEEIHIKQVD